MKLVILKIKAIAVVYAFILITLPVSSFANYDGNLNIQSHYGIMYNLTVLPIDYNPSELIQAVNILDVELNIDLRGVMVTDALIDENLAKIIKTKNIPNSENAMRKGQNVLLINDLMAFSPEDIMGVLKGDRPKTEREVEEGKIEKARKAALKSVFDDGRNKEEDNLGTKLAKVPIQFIEGIEEMMDKSKDPEQKKVTVEHYHLTFEQLFSLHHNVLTEEGVQKADAEYVHKTFYESGELLGEYNFKFGKLHGLSQEYFQNGQLKRSMHYRNDLLHGAYKSYNEQGVVIKDVVYSKNLEHGPYKEYYHNGQIKVEANFQDGERVDDFKEYWENGKLMYVEHYRKGVVDGLSKEFYEDGTLHYEDSYKNGVLDGKSKEYTKAGELFKSVNYLDGLAVETEY